MNKTFLQIGGIFALLGVILGAFGAHALEIELSAEQLNTYETGVRYQFYHAIAILICGVIMTYKNINLIWAARCFTIGIVLFSFSIYLLACRYMLGIENWTWLGLITPIGGTFFIAAWSIFLWQVRKL